MCGALSNCCPVFATPQVRWDDACSAGQAIAHHVLQSQLFLKSRRLGIYLHCTKLREVDTTQIVAAAVKAGMRLPSQSTGLHAFLHHLPALMAKACSCPVSSPPLWQLIAASCTFAQLELLATSQHSANHRSLFIDGALLA